MATKFKLTWFDAAKWSAVAAVVGGIAGGFLSAEQLDSAGSWAAIAQAAGLAVAGAAGAFLVAIRRQR